MVNINAKKNEIIVGSREVLAIKKIHLKNLNLLSDVEEYNENLFKKFKSFGWCRKT